jgi:hypothetical protein
MQCRHRMRRVALGHNIACATFALAALGGNAEFELDIVKAQPGTYMTGDFAVRNPMAYTDNHGGKRVGGWLLN